jgi:rhomboid protease GluP
MNMPLRTSKLKPTYVLIALNVIVYVYTSILSGSFLEMDYEKVLVQYGQYNAFVMGGAYWQLFTSMFVHVNIMHLVGNMLFLFIFGLRAEEMFDTREYIIIYLLGGLAGSLLTLLFGPDMVSAGASGAIFSIYGAVTIYVRRAIGQSILSALIFSFFLLLLSSGMGVNVLAHLGGLVVGLLIGYQLATTRKRRTSYQFSCNYSR